MFYLGLRMLQKMDHGIDSSVGQNSFVEDPVSGSALTDGVQHVMDHGGSMSGGTSFCTSHMGGGMVMYMDGFRFSLTGNHPCLNLYFPSWTLDTRGKFVAAMLGVVLLSILVEAVSKLRYVAQRNLRSTHHKYKRSLITLLHGVQALVGYILMLATMTFSVELLLCVVFGLGVGYAVFYEDGDNHVTTNPCCNFIQGEADERELNSKLSTSPERRDTPPSVSNSHDGAEEVSNMHDTGRGDAAMWGADTI